MAEWDGKVVLITGGAGGMGRAIARRFLTEGGTVYLGDVDRDGLERRAEEFSTVGGSIGWVVADVSKVSDCQRLVDSVAGETGRLDVLVNGAGVWVEGPSDEMTEDMWDRTIDINLKGTFFVSRYAIKPLEKHEGCIINISSDAGLLGNIGAAIYCASKGGVILLTRSMALELAPRKIRVNAVCPGDVDTPMLAGQARDYGGGDPEGYLNRLLALYPQGKNTRFITPEEVAEVVYFLASPKVTPITGTALSIDFGLTAGY